MTPLPPLFWRWAAWRLGHGPWRGKGPRSQPRPAEFPYAIPPRWWRAYLRMWPEKPKPPLPPPVQVRPPFAGHGVFTAHDPLSVRPLAGKVDWVALKADGNDRADPAVVGQLRAAGFKIYVWESEPSEGQIAVDRYTAEAYIAQAEGPGQLRGALALAPGLRIPKALVTNNFMASWPAGWVGLPEAYTNVNPNATPLNVVVDSFNLGATEAWPVFGVGLWGEANGRKVTLAEYLGMWADHRNFAIYLAETLDGNDTATLKGLA